MKKKPRNKKTEESQEVDNSPILQQEDSGDSGNEVIVFDQEVSDIEDDNSEAAAKPEADEVIEDTQENPNVENETSLPSLTVNACLGCGRTDNKAGAKFCGTCGHNLITEEKPAEEIKPVPISIVCPYCSLVNFGDEIFCEECGKALVPIEIKKQEDTNDTDFTENSAEVDYFSAVDFPIVVSSDSQTHTGLEYESGGKDYQEDTALNKIIAFKQHQIEVHVAIVADGIGGAPAGEVFSEMAVHSLWAKIRSPLMLPFAEQQDGFHRFEFFQNLNDKIKTNLPGVLRSVEEELYNLRNFWNLESKKGTPSGTTIALIIAVADLKKGHMILHGYHDGNSRIMMLVNESVTELSRISDHSLPDGTLTSYFGRVLHPNPNLPSGNSFEKELWFNECKDTNPLAAIILCSDGVEKEFNACISQYTENETSAADLTKKIVEWAINPDSCKKAGLDNAAVATIVITKENSGEKEEDE